jgi:hypothetical protein
LARRALHLQVQLVNAGQFTLDVRVIGFGDGEQA